MTGLDQAIAAARAALARARGSHATAVLDDVVAEIERAIALVRFEIEPTRGDPFYDEDFGGGAPQEPEGPLFAAFAAGRTALASDHELVVLMDALEALQGEIVFAADAAEFTDSRLNSIQYRYAAGRLRVAADRLATIAEEVAASTRDCGCLSRGPRLAGVESTFVGVDETAGRFADVELARCPVCGRMWLIYRVEREWETASGRWYAGVVSDEQAAGVKPETAPQVLESLQWHLVGGSYFGGAVSRRSTPLIDL